MLNINKQIYTLATLASGATEATPGTQHNFGDRPPVNAVRLTARATGVAGTITGALTITLSVSPDATNFDSADRSNLILTTTVDIGAATKQFSDLFYLAGAYAIRVEKVANTFGDDVTDVTVDINYVER